MNGVLPWLVHWARSAGKRDICCALAALVGPVQNIFFLTIHYFNTFVLIGQQAGQAAVLGGLNLSVCLWSNLGTTSPVHSSTEIVLQAYFYI
jgi:hypothetical protein